MLILPYTTAILSWFLLTNDDKGYEENKNTEDNVENVSDKKVKEQHNRIIHATQIGKIPQQGSLDKEVVKNLDSSGEFLMQKDIHSNDKLPAEVFTNEEYSKEKLDEFT